MEDDLLTDPLGLLSGVSSDLGDLNGATAPNSSPLPLSTPVNTSGGNTNTSGFSLGSFLSGLSGLGTTGANAYALIAGNKPATAAAAAPAATTTAASTLSKYLPYLLIGGVVLAAIGFLTRKK